MPARTTWLNLLFGRAPVDRSTYAIAICLLVLLHCGFQIGAIWLLTGHTVGPLTALNPLLNGRVSGSQAPGELLAALLAESLAIGFVGASMSVRRAIHAGVSGWTGLVVLVPLFNILLVLFLALAPKADVAESQIDDDNRIFLLPTFLSAAAGSTASVLLTAISVYGFGGYGSGLFLLTPFMMGLIVGYLLNRNAARTSGETVLAVTFSMLLTFGGLLLFAMEGFVCIAMAAPLAMGPALLGGVVGRMIALQTAVTVAHVAMLVLSLPLLMGAEKIERVAPLHEVVSAIEIDVPPERVWPRVVGFTDLPPPSELVFRLGIAYPVRARIDGRGVGAIRHCEFSTGAFVEPITRWEEPARLSFDVVSQPRPLHEWSPYANVHAPHLVGNMRSKRGEFRLVPLQGGRTRLEGSTWYELEMFPQSYWSLWSDGLVHAIHRRVLAHIKRLAESDASAG